MNVGDNIRKFSSCGPCIIQGRATKVTSHFVTVAHFTGKPVRFGKDRVHAEPCPSCTDHVQTQYPNGYMD